MSMNEIGAPRRRFEDRRLLLGQGQYVGDLAGVTAESLHVALVRSPFAHARIAAIVTAATLAAPGVTAVFTAADLGELAGMSVGAPSGPPVAPRTVFPQTHAHFVGEPLAAVVAETAAQANDALELMEVHYEDLPAIGSVTVAIEADAPLADTALPRESNVVFHYSQVAGDIDSAFAQADRVIRLNLVHGRVAGIPIEPRGVLVRADPSSGYLTIYLSTQAPFRARTELARILGIDRQLVR